MESPSFKTRTFIVALITCLYFGLISPLWVEKVISESITSVVNYIEVRCHIWSIFRKHLQWSLWAEHESDVKKSFIGVVNKEPLSLKDCLDVVTTSSTAKPFCREGNIDTFKRKVWNDWTKLWIVISVGSPHHPELSNQKWERERGGESTKVPNLRSSTIKSIFSTPMQIHIYSLTLCVLSYWVQDWIKYNYSYWRVPMQVQTKTSRNQ